MADHAGRPEGSHDDRFWRNAGGRSAGSAQSLGGCEVGWGPLTERAAATVGRVVGNVRGVRLREDESIPGWLNGTVLGGGQGRRRTAGSRHTLSRW